MSRIEQIEMDAEELLARPGLAALHGELQRGFRFLNNRHWKGELPPVVINFHPQPSNGRRLGHYLPRAWRDNGERSQLDEIVFYADLCLSLGWMQVFRTLAHEIVHHWQEHLGQPGKGPFHNAQWHAEAKRIGLSTTGPTGETTTTPAHENDRQLFGARIASIPFRVQSPGRAAGPGSGKLKKWTCGCGYAVRVAIPDFDATCNVCGEQFTEE